MASSWLSTLESFQRTAICAVLCLGFLPGCTSFKTMGSSNDSYGVSVTDRTLAQRVLDRSIENTALVNINRMDPTLHKRSRIKVYSFFSTVLVTGEIPDEQTKQEISAIISSMPDVKEFYNRLNVANPKGTSYTVHDAYISSKINAKILANKAISGSQVKIVTDDGVVYALGKLTPAQRGHLLNIIDSTVGIKELVLLTKLIDDYGAVIDESSISQEVGLESPTVEYTDMTARQSTASQPQVAYSQPAPTRMQAPTYPDSASQGGQYQNNQYQGAAVQSSNNGQQPVADPNNAEPYVSPYIEMYKEDVPGW